MKTLLASSAILLLSATVASAQSSPGGVTGFVLDAQTHKAVAGAVVGLYELPLNKTDETRLNNVLTNRKGFFSRMGLESGTYLVTANVEGRTASCVIRQVEDGLIRHVTIKISRDGETACEGPYVGAYDPDETSDVYRVH